MALGQIGNDIAIAPLISILQDKFEHRRLRKNTVYALEKIGIKQIFKPLKLALKDSLRES